MNGLKRRERYARWDANRTESLVRQILTKEVFRQKMLSLIDKHHYKNKPNSFHLRYGSVKEGTEQMGLSKDESRAVSIKMINIAKSFNKKPGLDRLFKKGWNLADKLAGEDARRRARHLPPADGVGTPSGPSDTTTLLEKVIKDINLKVQTFTRILTPKRIQKRPKQKQDKKTARRKFLGRTKSATHLNAVEEPAVLEVRSQSEPPRQSTNAVFPDDQLSRVSVADSPLDQYPDPYELDVSPLVQLFSENPRIVDQLATIQHLAQESLDITTEPSEKLKIRLIFERHVKTIEEIQEQDSIILGLNSAMISCFRNLRNRYLGN